MLFDSQTFDVLIACLAYHHFSDKNGFAKEAAHVLKPNGVAYIVDPCFTLAVRKMINTVIRSQRVEGEFFDPNEIASAFAPYGSKEIGATIDGYAQLVKLRVKKLA